MSDNEWPGSAFWTRLAVLPFAMMTIGADALAQAAHAAREVAEREAERWFDGPDCPCHARTANNDGDTEVDRGGETGADG